MTEPDENLQEQPEAGPSNPESAGAFENLDIGDALQKRRAAPKALIGKKNVRISQAEQRRTLRAFVAALLAILLWLGLLGICALHIWSAKHLADRLIAPDEVANDARQSQYDRAYIIVNDAAKTIYSFLTPLATAVTGYYFITVERERAELDDENS